MRHLFCRAAAAAVSVSDAGDQSVVDVTVGWLQAVPAEGRADGAGSMDQPPPGQRARPFIWCTLGDACFHGPLTEFRGVQIPEHQKILRMVPTHRMFLQYPVSPGC